MKIKTMSLAAVMSTVLITPIFAQAGNFEKAVNEATAEIDKAKAMNYEWRDSRKLIKKAEKLNKEGKSKKAMKLVAQAKRQGQLAVAQAKQQSSVNGPH